MIHELNSEHSKKETRSIQCMALYKAGAFAPLISGAVGATIFSHNSSGSYIKNLAIPVNRNTTYQVNQRVLMTYFAQQWRALTDAQRIAWNSYAASNPIINRFGDSITVSGFNCYCQKNININLGGGSAINAPVIPSSIVNPLTLSATCAINVITLTFTATPVPSNQAMFIWGTPPESAGKFFVKSQYRLFHVSAAAVASPLVATTFYTTRFGALPALAGFKLFFSIQAVNILTGEAGIPLTTSCIST